MYTKYHLQDMPPLPNFLPWCLRNLSGGCRKRYSLVLAQDLALTRFPGCGHVADYLSDILRLSSGNIYNNMLQLRSVFVQLPSTLSPPTDTAASLADQAAMTEGQEVTLPKFRPEFPPYCGFSITNFLINVTV
ncbi:hypothetical protein RRG08_011262 [Elysia crispata]|uniref:Uncharacterized protein n=1 Tax=Elysia crispata TaxID=231223 RepID=A0AAE0YNS4_9GAST|nr:hypothetical protein RRG08_011262 [Elysia crispata]